MGAKSTRGLFLLAAVSLVCACGSRCFRLGVFGTQRRRHSWRSPEARAVTWVLSCVYARARAREARIAIVLFPMHRVRSARSSDPHLLEQTDRTPRHAPA